MDVGGSGLDRARPAPTAVPEERSRAGLRCLDPRGRRVWRRPRELLRSALTLPRRDMGLVGDALAEAIDGKLSVSEVPRPSGLRSRDGSIDPARGMLLRCPQLRRVP